MGKKHESPSETPNTLAVPVNFGPPARFRMRTNPVDAKNYDFRGARTYLTHPNSVVDSVVHMLMCPLGYSVVVVHEVYKVCGVWTALPVNLVTGIIASYCVCVLVWSAQKVYGRVILAQLTYPDVMEASLLISQCRCLRKCARCFRYVVEATLMVNMFGSCCVFVLMIARNLKQLVEGGDVISDAGNPPIRVYILSLMLPCAVVCMVTDLKNLAPFAVIADFYAGVITFVTAWYSFKRNNSLNLIPYKSTEGLYQLIGVCLFSFESASIALPIENNMNEPKKFHLVVLGAMPILAVAMMVTGFCGYWHYREMSTAPITVHFPFKPFPVTLKVFLCLVLYVSYAMSFYGAFDIEWFYIKRHHQLSNHWFWERLYRTLHVALITIMTYIINDATKIMGFLGIFTSCPIILLFPPFIELLLDWEHPGLGRFKWRLLKCIFMMSFGVAIFVSGIHYNIITWTKVIEQAEQMNISMGIIPRATVTFETTLLDTTYV